MPVANKQTLAEALKQATLTTRNKSKELVNQRSGNPNASLEELKISAERISEEIIELDANARAEAIYAFIVNYVDQRMGDIQARLTNGSEE